jgi:subtilisin family serine protease
MTRKSLAPLLLSLSLAASALAGEFVPRPNAIPGRYLVVFKDGSVGALSSQAAAPGLSVAQQATSLAAFHGARTERTYEHALRGFVLLGNERAARAVAADPRVAFVEPDVYVQPFASQALPHWGLDRIDERDRPLNSHFTYNTTGAGVNIYVLDTGINADADLGSRRVNAFTTVVTSGAPDYNDCNGHGTKVAKIAGGTVAGVAKGATIRNVRVGSVCSTTCGLSGDFGKPGGPKVLADGSCAFIMSDVIAGVNWVTANRIRPAVANLSLGGEPNTTLDTAIRNLHNSGVVVVASAGNDGIDACSISPGREPVAITVGAVDANDSRSFWPNGSSSNTGSCIDLFAPGTNVNGFNGTSASAPVVSGAAALYLQSNTLAAPATVASHLVNNSTPNRLFNLGGGSPNRLLYVTPGGTESDAKPVAGNFTCSCNGGNVCTFSSSGHSDDFAVSKCRFSGPTGVFSNNCGTFIHAFNVAPGPYNVSFQVLDDANQVSNNSVYKTCQ